MNNLAWQIGLRFGRSRRNSSFVSFSTISSMIGIAVGVMALTIGLSAMNGFEHELEDRILSVVPQTEVNSYYQYMDDYEDYRQFLLEDQHILAAAPFIKVSALLEKKDSFKALQLRGIDPKLEVAVVPVDRYITQGSLDSLDNTRGNIILGSSIAAKNNIQVGDKVTFLLPQSDESSSGGIRSTTHHTFVVTGLFHMSGQLDSLTSFISLADASALAGLPEGAAQGISARTDDFLRSQQLVLNRARMSQTPVLVNSWMYTQGHLYRDIQMVRLIIYISLFVVIAVACFNIVSSLMMALNDKRSAIAILMTMGAKRNLVARIFIVMGMINGVMGVFSGLLLGYVISANLSDIFKFFEQITGRQLFNSDLHFIDFVPSQVQTVDFVVAGVGALLICFIATLYPAYKAGKTMPAQELSRGR